MHLLILYLSLNTIIFILGAVLSLERENKGWRGIAGTVFLVLIPLNIYGLSVFAIPDSKEACGVAGWIATMHVGKFALTPFVLWAVAAYLAHLSFPPQGPYPRWIVLGLTHGAIVAGLCSLFGLIVLESIWIYPFMICVPIYTTIGYFYTAVQCYNRNQVPPLTMFFHSCVEIPFWWVAMEWSQKVYENLPENSSDCFVVTAASKGHPKCVGPFDQYPGKEGGQMMNRQLYTFREFEKQWRRGAPCSHQHFRWIYNRIGPCIAGCIRNPWLADLVFLLLRPLEWIVAVFLPKVNYLLIPACRKYGNTVFKVYENDPDLKR